MLSGKGILVFHGCPQIARLSHYFLPQAIREGKRILYLDGANRFDPLLLTRMARQGGDNPSDFKNHVRVARAFTCFQLTELLVRAPNFLQSFPAELAILTALPELYFDEDVRDADAFASFDKGLRALRRLAGRVPVAVFSDPQSFPASRRKLFERVRACAGQVWKITEQENGKLNMASDRSAPRALPAARN